MTWSSYGVYVLISISLVLAPGPDTFVVLRAALAGGRAHGVLSAAGVFTASAAQGVAAAFGLGLLVVQSQTAFTVVRWLGVAYLTYLGLRAVRAAVRGRYGPLGGPSPDGAAGRTFAAGFLCNITNPKILVMYVSVLPQFLDPQRATVADALLLALTVAVVGTCWLIGLALAAVRMRGWLSSRRARRSLDAVAGTAFLGFGGAMALNG
ncbi:LysE family translocator [Pseudonocardia sp. HH130630-07]|uniref:LysE family translocator n=1 Tax=Pseudonocardia sp. HH130630-07 TaxID=1690815 RepID=UPI000814F61D|nr:LysE family translocator [Pseudonocardia sp. HH130630-07]ANY07239.1 lysine transporter LysE [Pseudonocardia sp. HH130630-07]